MRCLMTLVLSVFLATSAMAANWDAQTRRTNTSVQDSDIQVALTKGLPPQFAQNFPSKSYGIYVLIDRSNVKELNHDVVYISLGLCKRRSDGSYTLPSVTYSTTTALSSGNQAQEHQMVIQKLTAQASEFAQLVIQNSGKIK